MTYVMQCVKMENEPSYSEDMKFMLIENIIKERKKQKLSQLELAKKAGTSQYVISRIETRRIDPSLNKLIAILKALNLDINDIF